MTAALDWLEENFTVGLHPGKCAPARQVVKASAYYYYCWSLAHAFTRCGIDEVVTSAEPVRWRETLADELIGPPVKSPSAHLAGPSSEWQQRPPDADRHTASFRIGVEGASEHVAPPENPCRRKGGRRSRCCGDRNTGCRFPTGRIIDHQNPAATLWRAQALTHDGG